MVRYLTVGEISTLIAAAVFIFGFLLPNAFALILVKCLNKQPTAATWGYVQRTIAATDWATFLQTDSVSCSAVEWKVRWLGWMRLAMVALLAVAAVLTPAGLYDQLKPDESPTPIPFTLISDQSSFGVGTQIHNSWPWRQCRGSYNDTITIEVPCPGDNQTYSIIDNSTGVYQIYEGGFHRVEVDPSRVGIFHSGLKDHSPTVSSFFDIKSRRIARGLSNAWATFIHPFPVVSYHFLKNVASEDRLIPIEGLVVDAHSGSIGFRNHSAPRDATFGVTWNEDLLFLEADTACVDLNLTVEFEVAFSDVANISTLDGDPFTLVDEGAFANFKPAPKPQYSEVNQKRLDLEDRARITAWYMLDRLMRYPNMNLSDLSTGDPDPTKSKVGRRFNGLSQSLGVVSYDGIEVTNSGDFLLQMLFPNRNLSDSFLVNNPDLHILCNPWRRGNKTVDLDLINIECGYLIGAARRVDGPTQILPDEGTSLRRKIYSCASATKVSIKKVDFSFNTSTSNPLDGLKVNNITEKQFANENEQPLWGMETPKPMLAMDIWQLWGIVSREYENALNLSTIRSPHFYPPSHRSIQFYDSYKGENYLPASIGLGDVLAAIYNTKPSTSTAGSTGAMEVAMLQRWQNLSQDAASAANLMKLLFTDVAANTFVGTRGWLSSSKLPPPFENATGPLPERQVTVYQYHRRVYYHWPFAIPAFLIALLLLITLTVALVFALTGSIGEIARLLPSLSAGRLLLDLLPNSEANYSVPYKRWASTYGQRGVAREHWGWSTKSSGTGPEYPLGPMPPSSNLLGNDGFEKQSLTSVTDTRIDQPGLEDRRPFLNSHLDDH